MIRGLYISGTNMLTATKKLDVVGNNIANASVVGYKKDGITVESFNDVLISKRNASFFPIEKSFDSIDVQKNNSGYNLTTEIGFFRVQTEDGISYNKNIKLGVDKEGHLSTYYLNTDRTVNDHLGYKVLDSEGRHILVEDKNYEINDKGEVLVDGESVAKLVMNTPRNVIGTINSGVKEIRMVTDHSQGQLKNTGKPLDVAISGEGYFEVTKNGKSFYTRNGVFNLDSDNVLRTIDGFEVQGRDGAIELPTQDIRINQFGEIIHNDELIDKIKVIDFTNNGDLEKVGATNYLLSNNMVGEKKDFQGNILQGTLERSNVNNIEEMIKMTKINRNYESSQKVIRSIDETLDKVINQVGVLR